MSHLGRFVLWPEVGSWARSQRMHKLWLPEVQVCVSEWWECTAPERAPVHMGLAH